MKNEMEQIIINSVTDGVMKSSLLASSLAVRLMDSQEFVSKVIDSIDKEALVDRIAKEFVRSAVSGVNKGSARWVSSVNIERRIADMLFAKMSKDAEVA